MLDASPKEPEMEICKFQMPLATNSPERLWLIYNEDRSTLAEVPEDMIPLEVHALMVAVGTGKLYLYAHLNEVTNFLTIGDQAPTQDW